MTGFRVADAARICGGTLVGGGGDALIRRVVIDSRRVQEGDLFVALPGTRTHGNAFVADALDRGAVAAIVRLDNGDVDVDLTERALVRVKFPRIALADLAAAHRRTLRCPVIAVTGSNGKSTTREMIARVLAPLGPIVQSEKSFNNDLGVPLTILRADEDTAALVVEMGTNGRGEIKHLCGITRPDVGVVTNVAHAHLEGLRSLDGVAYEKGHLAECLPPEGTLILNADDPRVVEMGARTRADRVLTYSVSRSTAFLWGHEAQRTERGIAVWLLGKMRVELPVHGMHNLSNAMAAATVGMAHGVTADEICRALAEVELQDLRMQVASHGGVAMILDCYNANPGSLEAAVDELVARSGDRRRVVVLGDMMELGLASEQLHHEAGWRLAEQVHVLWCIGNEARAAAEGALDAGLHPEQVFWSATTDAAIEERHVRLTRGDAVLFKGSRGMQLERLAEVEIRALRARAAAAAGPVA